MSGKQRLAPECCQNDEIQGEVAAALLTTILRRKGTNHFSVLSLGTKLIMVGKGGRDRVLQRGWITQSMGLCEYSIDWELYADIVEV